MAKKKKKKLPFGKRPMKAKRILKKSKQATLVLQERQVGIEPSRFFKF